MSTEGHAPTVAWKPGMNLGCWTMGNCTLAGGEGAKIAFHTCRIYEEMTTGSTNVQQSVRVGNQAAAAEALIGFGTITSNFVQKIKKTKHFWFQRQASFRRKRAKAKQLIILTDFQFSPVYFHRFSSHYISFLA
jgi:hypothetical protein